MVYLSDIGFIQGGRTPIEEAAHPEQEARVLRLLKDDGFQWFSKSNKSVAQLAVQAVVKSLERANIQASEIDALIFCTESFWDVYRQRKDGSEPRDAFVSEVCLAAGLIHAVPYGLWLRGCTNFASALSLARALILSGQHHMIMVVMADRAGANAKRLSGHGPTIFSDGAAALIVSARRRGYAIRSINLHFSEKLARIRGQKNLLLYGRTLIEELRIFRETIEARAHYRLCDHDVFLTDNFHSMSFTFLYDSLSIDKGKLSSPTKSDGHFFSADCPLSLLQLEKTMQGSTGVSFALMSVGPSGATSMSLLTV